MRREREPVRTEEALTLIFLHLPRTGGTTLNAVLKRNYGLDRYWYLGRPGADALQVFSSLPPSARQRYRVVAGHRIWGVDRFTRSPSTYLTLLRDPIARTVSHYLFVRRNPRHPHHELVVSRNLGIGDYMTRGRLDNYQVRDVTGDYSAPLEEAGPDLLERAKFNLDTRFSAVGLTERFDESLLLFARSFGWEDLRYLKRNIRSPEQAFSLSDKDRQIIERFTQLDRELYEYARARFRRDLALLQDEDPSMETLAGLRRRNKRYSFRVWAATSRPLRLPVRLVRMVRRGVRARASR